jgi:peptidoglycan/LPS O-acetylase OafA/YrhL
MGILRTILALAVIVYHSYKIFGLRMCGGQVAVEAFYIISGFYMALILNEKYIGHGHYKKFLLSRFLRIFPVYWIVLILAFLLSLTGYLCFDHSFYLARYISNYDCLSGFTLFYFVLENIIVIGQDILYFLRLDELCRPILTYNVLSFKHTGYQYLFVPQAWTISIECMFYLIAPFLVTRKLRLQVALVLVGLCAKYYFANQHYLCFDPWTYRFFPFELAYFLSGSVAYRLYRYLKQNPVPDMYGYILLSISVFGIIFYDQIAVKEALKNSLYYLFIFGAIPFIFLAFKNNKIDRFIGELSFSLYICHHLIVSMFRSWFFAHPDYLYLYGYTVVFGSLIVAFMLQIVVINRIELYRHKRFS